jgi:hypothetical protein
MGCWGFAEPGPGKKASVSSNNNNNTTTTTSKLVVGVGDRRRRRRLSLSSLSASRRRRGRRRRKMGLESSHRAWGYLLLCTLHLRNHLPVTRPNPHIERSSRPPPQGGCWRRFPTTTPPMFGVVSTILLPSSSSPANSTTYDAHPGPPPHKFTRTGATARQSKGGPCWSEEEPKEDAEQQAAGESQLESTVNLLNRIDPLSASALMALSDYY